MNIQSWNEDPSPSWDEIIERAGIPDANFIDDTPDNPAGDIDHVIQKMWPDVPNYAEGD